MIRLIFEVAIILAIVYFVREITGPGSKSRKSAGKKPAASADEDMSVEELVKDPHCGVYIPRTQAVKGDGGQWFCSEACKKAHGAGQG